jgi:hypothetical protein
MLYKDAKYNFIIIHQMENTKLSLKVQLDDKVKRLLEKEYADLADLKVIIQNSFKNLQGLNYVLKYMDNEGDWLYIIDDSDLQALKEYSKEKSGKSIKLVIESQDVLAQSVVEPRRFNESQIKDSCVAEVENFLKSQEEVNLEEVKLEQIPEESLKRADSSEMDVEIVEMPQQMQVEDSNQVLEALRQELENARISAVQPEKEQEIAEPVIVEEIKVPEAVVAEPEVQETEEVIDTSNQNEEMKVEEPQVELQNFSILDCLQNVENVLNSTDKDVKPKDIFKAVKDSAQGTKAEKNIKQMVKGCKKGKGFFIKKIMKAFMGGKCGEEQTNSGVIHRGITCDGCGVRPVKGIRYKCSECPDYDLCQACESKDVHNHHIFLKVKNPMGIDIIYSHRTDEAPTQPSAEPQFPHQVPHHAPPHHGGRGGMGRGPWGRHGGRGGAGCGQNWQQNNPLMQLAKQFLGGLNDSDSDENDAKPKGERKKAWDLRPVIIKNPVGPIIGNAGGMQIIETTIQNQSPWPYRLNWVKMIEADEGISFQPIETDVLLKNNESQDFCLAVQLPEKAGTYKATFGFINHKGKMQGQQMNVEFQVLEDMQ